MKAKENPSNSSSSHGDYDSDAPYLVEISRRKCPGNGAQPVTSASTASQGEARRLYCNNGQNATFAVLACIEHFVDEFPDTLPQELEYSVKLMGPEGPEGPCSEDLRSMVNSEAVREKVLVRSTCPLLPVFEYTAFFSVPCSGLSAWATIEARGVTHAYSMIVQTLESIGAWSLLEPFPSIDLFNGCQPPLENHGHSLCRLHTLREPHHEGAPVAIEEGGYVGPGYTHLSHKTGFALTDDIPDIHVDNDEGMNVLLMGKHRQRNTDVISELFQWEMDAVPRIDTYIYQPPKKPVEK